jgi:hypothetical protein
MVILMYHIVLHKENQIQKYTQLNLIGKINTLQLHVKTERSECTMLKIVISYIYLEKLAYTMKSNSSNGAVPFTSLRWRP